MLNPNDYVGDRSFSYLSMCKESSELQAIRKDKGPLELYAGDYYADNLTPDGVKMITEMKMIITDPLAVWLPTTNQLIDLFTPVAAIEVFVAITDHWRKEVPYLRKIDEQSAEQLLLAWFMSRRYRKCWNGSQWVKDELET